MNVESSYLGYGQCGWRQAENDGRNCKWVYFLLRPSAFPVSHLHSEIFKLPTLVQNPQFGGASVLASRGNMRLSACGYARPAGGLKEALPSLVPSLLAESPSARFGCAPHSRLGSAPSKLSETPDRLADADNLSGVLASNGPGPATRFSGPPSYVAKAENRFSKTANRFSVANYRFSVAEKRWSGPDTRLLEAASRLSRPATRLSP